MQVEPVVSRDRTLLLQDRETLCVLKIHFWPFLDRTVIKGIGSEVGESKRGRNGNDNKPGFELWLNRTQGAIEKCLLRHSVWF